MITETLKKETKALHDKLEFNPLSIQLQKGLITQDTYRDLLVKYYQIHLGLEKKLSEYPKLQMEKRERLTLLQRDLDSLSVDISKIPLIETFDISSLSHAYGVLYVFEGSRMGGMMISKQLIQTNPSITIHYFNGYGEQTIPNFMQFKQDLDHSNLDEAQTLQGAIDTFNLFIKEFNKSY